MFDCHYTNNDKDSGRKKTLTVTIREKRQPVKVTDSDHGVILKKSCTEGVSDCDGNRDSDGDNDRDNVHKRREFSEAAYMRVSV